MHGLSGIGKIPLATSVGLAASGYHLAEADRADVPNEVELSRLGACNFNISPVLSTFCPKNA